MTDAAFSVSPALSAAPSRSRIRVWAFWSSVLFLTLILGLAIWYVLHMVLPRNFKGNGDPVTLNLHGGPFDIQYYSSGKGKPKGIVVLGTGQGGWSYWEENTAQNLLRQGYVVAGWDCRKFADSREYNQQELADGFTAAAETARRLSHAGPVPVWYGGWSTGAEQSVAAAASDHRPSHLVGLLLAAPASRGRYGMTTSDLLGVTPTGDGSFGLADFAEDLKGIKVVQFEAGLDVMDDTTWLEDLHVPTKVIELPTSLHDMGGAGPEFQECLVKGIQWTLEKPSTLTN